MGADQASGVAAPAVPAAGEHRAGRRLMLLLGLAYLMLAALASGLPWAYFESPGGQGGRTDRDCDRESSPGPERFTPPSEPPAPDRPPEPDPDAPGLHTRPDGSRYLIVPIPPGLDGRRRPAVAIAPGGAA
ncbi:hypothetical protein [Glycomyces xiaoerkulensis]|uniref:hypothetical protein n=1 Tax=Glycomyces xiaoerkulensis TaxID=2038139 RepID=UPI0018E4894C|nr:hypothetical protein [Glycomyces xiaoerkulensis]